MMTRAPCLRASPANPAAGQTAPSYLAAAACGVTEPTDTAAIGFPGMHIVMNVTGDADVTPPEACTRKAGAICCKCW